MVDPPVSEQLVVACIGYEPVLRLPVFGESKDEYVVSNHSICIGNHRILGLAWIECRYVVRAKTVHQGLRVGTPNFDRAHMRDVEASDPLADGPVFGPDRPEVDGHCPAAEIGEAGTRRDVRFLKR